MAEKKKVKRFNIAKFLVLILVIYVLVCFGIYVYKQPIRHFEIKGNNILKDVDILRDLNLDKYPSYISVNRRKLKKKLESNSLVLTAKIKYGWNFKIIIEIEENKPTFMLKSTNQICLSNGELIDARDDILGLPVLLNATPTEIQNNLANHLSLVDDGILYSISEIEYRPTYSSIDNQIMEDNKFLLSMNDGNLVYITSDNAEILNSYLDIIATNKITGNGILNLDSDEPGNLFQTF